MNSTESWSVTAIIKALSALLLASSSSSSSSAAAAAASSSSSSSVPYDQREGDGGDVKQRLRPLPDRLVTEEEKLNG